ncbi:hypothetical protein [Hydrogenophaga electricum]|uniref:Uncharacterized protein n=1 Tax=Hydrogenophaga electricum TaxID=1230953 RepID=A0ABQ6CEA2_9BURK|nr:hypothetical protein [Hydrogenophaga electricum]GLS16572.1 hypothetical protein GCM10007935_40140 [Hydrogenophaga electricum]
MNLRLKLVAVGGLFGGLVASAHAELPAGFDSLATTIVGDVGDAADAVAPIMIAVIGAVVGFKLIKRFVSVST